MKGSFFCVRCSSASIFTAPERTELSVWTKYSASSEVIRNWEESKIIYICYNSFCFSLPPKMKRVISITFFVFFINSSCFHLHHSVHLKTTGIHIFLQVSASCLKYPIFSPCKYMTLSFLTLKSHYWQNGTHLKCGVKNYLLSASQISYQPNKNTSVILSPTTPSLPSYSPPSSSTLGPKAMEVAFPGRTGKPNSASCQQPQSSARGGMSVFMQGSRPVGYQLAPS